MPPTCTVVKVDGGSASSPCAWLVERAQHKREITTGQAYLVANHPSLANGRKAAPHILATHLGPLGGAEMLAGSGFGCDGCEVDTSVLVVGIELHQTRESKSGGHRT